MKTIKSLKELTTLEVSDIVVFSSIEYTVRQNIRNSSIQYYLSSCTGHNNEIFEVLNFEKRNFIEKLGIIADSRCDFDFPETKSLEALTAIVSALFKEYEKQNTLPKTWEEFCERNPITPDEYWIETVDSRYCSSLKDRKRDINKDKNVCVSLQEAEAFTALRQLRQLRKAYVKDWEPDWTSSLDKYCINFRKDRFRITTWGHISNVLSFPTCGLAEQFLTNFKDLLEIAKPLL